MLQTKEEKFPEINHVQEQSKKVEVNKLMKKFYLKKCQICMVEQLKEGLRLPEKEMKL